MRKPNIESFLSLLTWKTVTVAQSSESKFFLSQKSSSPTRSQNLQPNRFIPKMLTRQNRQLREKKTTLVTDPYSRLKMLRTYYLKILAY